MSIKRRIWSLPTTAIVIFSIGLAVCVYFSSIAVSSITQNSKLNYPVLDKTKILAIDIQALSKDLEDAVGNTDKKEFRLVQDNAKKIIANKASSAAPKTKLRLPESNLAIDGIRDS